MADAESQHDDQQDDEAVLDLEVPADEADSVAGGTPNVVRTQHDQATAAINKIRP